ncbi:MAG: helix-turn-helix domain-containing protein [Pseudomonadota bacterium]
MKYTTYEHMNCSVAQSLNILGERWVLLIIRDALFGAKRFVQFERSLGIARNVLTARLNRLVEEGLMEKRPGTETNHPEYVLTQAGRDLEPVLLALTHWGDTYRPNPKGRRLIFKDRETGTEIRPISAVTEDGRSLPPGAVTVELGPGGEPPLQPVQR